MAASPVTSQPSDTCTDGPQFSTQLPEGATGGGLVSRLSSDIRAYTGTMAADIYNMIVVNSIFIDAVHAAVTLYIAIYAMGFMFGFVRVSAHDFILRSVKVAIMGVLVGGASWSMFQSTFGAFFNTFVDEIIGQFGSFLLIGTMDIPIAGYGNLPMFTMDRAISTVISANMGVHILATFFTPPYGFFYCIIMVIALWSYVSMLLTGIWVILMSIVMRGILIGVAPIFLACLLFTRTRQFFTGWLNQLINACLQPILLFTFFTFFVLVSNGFVNQIINVPVCWTGAGEMLRGTPFDMHFWRYTIPSSETENGFEPYGGLWTWSGPASAGGGPVFPINFFNLMLFLVISELGRKFCQVVLMVARDISASSVDLSDMQNAFSGLAPVQRAAPGSAGVAAAKNDLRGGDLVGALKNNISRMVGR